MKYKILFYSMIAATICSCSSAYKASQTPDDVYYSPAKPAAARHINQDRYEDYIGSTDDQYLRMKVQDRARWSSIDDYSYWNDSRYIPAYSYDYYLANGYNSYYFMNNWSSPYYYNPLYSGAYGLYGFYYPQFGYSPYLSSYISKRPVVVSPTTNRPFLNGYNNRSYNNRNSIYNNNSNYNRQVQGYGSSSSRRAYEPTNTYSNRNINNNTFNNNTYRAPERSYSPSPSYSPSGGSAGAISRPSRH